LYEQNNFLLMKNFYLFYNFRNYFMSVESNPLDKDNDKLDTMIETLFEFEKKIDDSF